MTLESQNTSCENCETERGDPRRIKNYLLSILGGEKHVKVESTLMKYALACATPILIFAVLLFALVPSFAIIAKPYSHLLLLSVLGSITVLFSYHHALSYKKAISCMNGMMVGMTIGMISGFLVGAIVASANGMFVGSMVGISFGVALGVNSGRCCGVMGALEGMMAGLMAGIMGAMTSLMLINDNVILFLYLLFFICSVCLGGLSYMVNREYGKTTPAQLSTTLPKFALSGAIMVLIIAAIMLFGPRSEFSYISYFGGV